MRKNGIIIVMMLVAILSGIMTVKGYEDTCLPEKFTSEIIFDPQNNGKHPPFFLPGEQVQVKVEFSRSPKGCEGFDVVLKSDSPYISFQNPIKKSRSLEMTMIISSNPDIVRSANPKIIAMLVHGSRSIILEKDIITGERTQIQELKVVPEGFPVSFHSFSAAVSDNGKNSLSYCLLVLTNETGVEIDKGDKTVVYGKSMSKIKLTPKEAGIYTITADCKNFAGASKIATIKFLVNLSETKKDKPYIITARFLNVYAGESFFIDFSGTNSFGEGLKANITENGIIAGQCGDKQCKVLLNSIGTHTLKLDMQYQFPEFKYSGVSSTMILVFVSQNQSGKSQAPIAQRQAVQPTTPRQTSPPPMSTTTAVKESQDSDPCGKEGVVCKTSSVGGFAVIAVFTFLAWRMRKNK